MKKLYSYLPYCGGSLGGLMGMYVFHHKTKKLKFKIGFPLILILQIGLILYLITNNMLQYTDFFKIVE